MSIPQKIIRMRGRRFCKVQDLGVTQYCEARIKVPRDLNHNILVIHAILELIPIATPTLRSDRHAPNMHTIHMLPLPVCTLPFSATRVVVLFNASFSMPPFKSMPLQQNVASGILCVFTTRLCCTSSACLLDPSQRISDQWDPPVWCFALECEIMYSIFPICSAIAVTQYPQSTLPHAENV